MRQLTIFSKRKMDANLRQQTLVNQLFGAELTEQITNSSQKGLLICTCNLQVS
jgi:hypothetical protein